MCTFKLEVKLEGFVCFSVRSTITYILSTYYISDNILVNKENSVPAHMEHKS